mgnify:CR=1 FL=1
MSWGGIGRMCAAVVALWFTGLVMCWISILMLQNVTDSMTEGWKDYPMHDWQSGCTVDNLRKACPPCECE